MISLGKWTTRLAVAFVLGAVAAVALMAILASRPPGRYAPVELPPAGQERQAKVFYRRLMDISNQAQRPQAITWTLTQPQLSAYLASLDAIVAQLPSAGPREVTSRMSRVGLTSPAVALGDGELTLMVTSTQARKVLSVRLGLEVADGLTRVDWRGARVGMLPVPVEPIRRRLAEAVGPSLVDPAKPAEERSDLDAAAQTAGALLLSDQARPIVVELDSDRWRLTGAEIRPSGVWLELSPDR
jgi:hypothetical protein